MLIYRTGVTLTIDHIVPSTIDHINRNSSHTNTNSVTIHRPIYSSSFCIFKDPNTVCELSGVAKLARAAQSPAEYSLCSQIHALSNPLIVLSSSGSNSRATFIAVLFPEAEKMFGTWWRFSSFFNSYFILFF